MATPHRLRLDFIDGMRALAALYIVLNHSLQSAEYASPWLSFLGRGHDVVAIFIAISGFCLALPMAQHGRWNLQTWRFYKKRARRILPPYFAAVAIGLFFVLVYSHKSDLQDYAGAPVSSATVITHVLLVQNWSRSQMYTLDGPLWSIAVEWQIYILFPLIILLWRYGGRWLTLLVSFVVAHGLLYATHYGGYANFLFLFVVGMLGAELAFSDEHKNWLGIATLSSIAAYLLSLLIPRTPYVISDIFIALSAALTMAYLTRNPQHWAGKILGWRLLAWLGTFSYSIYLVHNFFQWPVRRWILESNVGHLADSHAKMAVVMVFIVAPLAVAASYVFHVIFERPFVSPGRQIVEQKLAPTL